MLKTQIFEKKGNLSSEKFIKTDFSRFIECKKPHTIFDRGQEGALTIIVQVIRSFRQQLIGC